MQRFLFLRLPNVHLDLNQSLHPCLKYSIVLSMENHYYQTINWFSHFLCLEKTNLSLQMKDYNRHILQHIPFLIIVLLCYLNHNKINFLNYLFEFSFCLYHLISTNQNSIRIQLCCHLYLLLLLIHICYH